MKKNEFRLLFLCLSLFFLFNIIVQPPNSAAQMKASQNFLKPPAPPANSNKGDILQGRYIVKFKDPPLSVYRGGLPNLPPTNPSARGEKKLNASDPDSINYLDYLSRSHLDIHHKMEKALGHGVNITHSFQVVFNGVAVKMSAAEARRIAKLPEIADVIPDKMRHLHTDNGPQWIGADDVWNGSVSAATKGEGIVIGIIDTGINPANASFADVGGDGYNHSNPRPKCYGFCDSGHPDYNATFQCNDKLIGAYDFARDSGEPAVLYDNDGHGSHTASTAAGNVVDPAALVAPTISFNRTISGVAPHSNIISYKACRDGCKLSWLLAAIEQATLDGVDVINYSIGGGAADPWVDADSEAFLNARQAGIFVATSAGNNGPGSETLGSPGNAPWLLTVGSSSHDRRFNNSLTSLTRTDGGPLSDIQGRSITSDLSTTSIVYAGNYGDALCLNPFDPGTFTGQIVVCDRGQIARVKKGENVLAGGAGGYVLANDEPNGDSINSDSHALPAVHIGYNDGVVLKNWLAAGSNHQAAISGTTVDENAAYGNIMSSFSSRGANAPLLSVIKPDVSAPGQSILAADGSGNEAIWGVMSGTSMSSPHAAGASALLIDLYSGWSPAEIQSALMTSSDSTVLKEDATTPADPFDTGTGRIAVNQAAQAGIVLDETYAHYVDADPAKGGDPKTLNIPSLGNENIVVTTTWNRTLTSTLGTSMGWNAGVTNPSGVALTVVPSNFTLPAGGTQQVAITADAGAAAFDNWLFGSVVFTPTGAGTVPAKFPVALKRRASNLPSALRYDNVAKISSKTLQNREAIEITDLTPSYYGLTGATVHIAKLYQDPTPGDPWDGEWDPEDGDGLWVKMVTVPANTKRLVAEIVETDSPDIDMYLYRRTVSGWVWVCSSARSGSNEYCSVLDPVEGDYYIWMHNYEARDPSGTNPDNVQLATAVVPDASAGNLTVSLANGGNSVPAGQSFDLKISWNLTGTAAHWYGRFGLGTDSANPNNLGIVDLDLHVNHPPMPWLLLLLLGD